MKMAFVVSTQPTQFAAAAFAPDFEHNVARLASLGYQGVELAVRDPLLLDKASIHRALQTHRLQVPAIGTGQLYVEEHLSFTDPDPEIRRRAVERIHSHLLLAQEFNALLIVGLVRGKLAPGISTEQAYEWLVPVIKKIASEANERQVRLILEPINRYETNLLNTVEETRALIDQVGYENVGILFDTFHANIEEPQIASSLRACGSRLFHVHVADSNRWAPGAGHVDFGQVFAILREMHYEGWISGEMLAKPDMLSAAEQTMATLRPMLQRTVTGQVSGLV